MGIPQNRFSHLNTLLSKGIPPYAFETWFRMKKKFFKFENGGVLKC
jgi:hypothetical protein